MICFSYWFVLFSLFISHLIYYRSPSYLFRDIGATGRISTAQSNWQILQEARKMMEPACCSPKILYDRPEFEWIESGQILI